MRLSSAGVVTDEVGLNAQCQSLLVAHSVAAATSAASGSAPTFCQTCHLRKENRGSRHRPGVLGPLPKAKVGSS